MKPRPLRTEQDHAQALERLDQLLDKPASRSRNDDIEVLSLLVERYETERIQVSLPTPVQAIRFRMEQGGLSPRDLEPYLGTRARVSEVLRGTRPLSIDMIRALHRHLDIPAEVLIAEPGTRTAPEPSRAALDKLVEMGFLNGRGGLSDLMARAFGPVPAAAMLRKTRTERTNAKTDAGALQAWCAAVLLQAKAAKVKAAGRPCDANVARELAALSPHDDGPQRAVAFLARLGIVLVVLEHLPGTYLDGAVLRRSDGVPVIALTLRHDRIDNFWFTLLHELAHVCLHLDRSIDMILDDLEISGENEIEAEADAFARDALVPPDVWASAHPDMEQTELAALAARAGVHVAIAAGRWQRENRDYRRFSRLIGRGEVRKQFPHWGRAAR